MSALVENPIFWIAVTVLLEAILAIALVRTGRGALIGAMIAVLVLGAAGLLLERVVVTEREEVEAAFVEIAAALERNDVPGVMARLAPEAGQLRTEASNRMPRVEISDARIRDLKVSFNRHANPPTARAQFKAIVEGRDKQGEVPYEHFIRQFSVGLRREGDRWLLTDYTSFDPLDPDSKW
jgi:ketosteroid isomerase-like protein